MRARGGVAASIAMWTGLHVRFRVRRSVQGWMHYETYEMQLGLVAARCQNDLDVWKSSYSAVESAAS